MPQVKPTSGFRSKPSRKVVSPAEENFLHNLETPTNGQAVGKGKRVRKTHRRTFTFQEVDDALLSKIVERTADVGARPTPTKTDVIRMGLMALNDTNSQGLLKLYNDIQRPEPEYE